MKESIKAILVDDEESARNVLEKLLRKFCPEVELLGKYENVPEAVEALKTTSVDVVFLDIEMPNYAGYELLRFFEPINFEVIFITAFDRYAMKAFELAALDYLLKPIEIERLQSAVQRLGKRIAEKSSHSAQIRLLQETLESRQISKITLMEKGFRRMVEIDEIVAFEAQESYSRIYFLDGSNQLVSKKLKYYEDLLAENPHFFRSHKSWLINQHHLRSYSTTRFEIILEPGVTAKLSRYRRDEFLENLK